MGESHVPLQRGAVWCVGWTEDNQGLAEGRLSLQCGGAGIKGQGAGASMQAWNGQRSAVCVRSFKLRWEMLVQQEVRKGKANRTPDHKASSEIGPGPQKCMFF